MALYVGAAAPDFTLPDQNGRAVSLDQLLENGPLVLFFYPRDHSFGCTRQVSSFRDNYEALLGHGVTAAGVSKDSEQEHESFIAKHQLPFPLLIDRDGEIHRRYGCLAMFGMITRRITFLIDSRKKIRLCHEDNFKMNSHVEKVMKVLGSGEVR